MTGLSFSSRIPMATGMVNTTVAPSMEPVITPPRAAAWASWVSSRASAPPPISHARMDPANMAASAPSSRNTGTTMGRSTAASTGARQTMPTMDSASAPMDSIPFSNSAPMPKRPPKIRSAAPSRANAAMRAISSWSADMVYSSECFFPSSTMATTAASTGASMQ